MIIEARGDSQRTSPMRTCIYTRAKRSPREVSLERRDSRSDSRYQRVSCLSRIIAQSAGVQRGRWSSVVVGDATSSVLATGVSLFPRLSRSAAVYSIGSMPSAWRGSSTHRSYCQTNVGHTLALERRLQDRADTCTNKKKYNNWYERNGTLGVAQWNWRYDRW